MTHYGFEVSASEVGFADAPQKQGGQAKGNANTTPNTTDGVPARRYFLEMLTDFLMIFPALEAISVMRKLTRTPCHSK